jgi:hypothetical protein
MPKYEYRILADDDQPGNITGAISPTDFMAIQAAKKLAAGRPMEVWRGDICIYALTPPSHRKPGS